MFGETDNEAKIMKAGKGEELLLFVAVARAPEGAELAPGVAGLAGGAIAIFV